MTMNDQQGNWAVPPGTTTIQGVPPYQQTNFGTPTNNPRVFPRNDSSASNLSYGTNNNAAPQRVGQLQRRASGRTSNTGDAGIIVANRAGDEETEDGRIRNREAAAKIRDAWIYKQIRARQVSLYFVRGEFFFLLVVSWVFLESMHNARCDPL